MNDLIENGEFPVFGANGIIGRYHSYNHPESEVVITCRGATCGTINKTLPRSWITGNAMVAHPKSGRLSKEYLFYCLKFSDLSSTISGSAQPQITRASLSPFKIPLPPLTVQKEIVAELDSYQKIIDGAKQVVDNWKPHIDIDPEWDSYPYKEIFTTLTAPMKIQTSEYSSSGAYPIIDQSMHEIAGWTDDERALVRIEKPVVIFGDHTCRIKYISKNFCQGADGIKNIKHHRKCHS